MTDKPSPFSYFHQVVIKYIGYIITKTFEIITLKSRLRNHERVNFELLC